MRACFSRYGVPQAFLYAFDLLELDGQDVRTRPWASRREVLVRWWLTPITASDYANTSKTSTAQWCSVKHGAGANPSNHCSQRLR